MNKQNNAFDGGKIRQLNVYSMIFNNFHFEHAVITVVMYFVWSDLLAWAFCLIKSRKQPLSRVGEITSMAR